MALNQAQLADFADYGRRPETWLIGSRRNLAVFEVLSDRVESLRMQSEKSQDEFSGCIYGAYLHAGLAVENAVKASLVRSDPAIVEAGKVQRNKLGRRAGHAFVELSEQILGTLSQAEKEILFKLEEHVVWAGKYTVPMRAEVLYDQDSLQILRTAHMNEREMIRSLVSRLQNSAIAP